jgi:two-component system, cell cycle response regulator
LLRVESVLRAWSNSVELRLLRQTSMLSEPRDAVIGAYSRATLISMLFRETDRVQRMKTSLCLIRFDIDDYRDPNPQNGSEVSDYIVCQVVERTTRLFRSYDLLGRVGKLEFLLALPGCDNFNAMMLAERLRMDVFGSPFQDSARHIRLSACFGVASSNGRSPSVVLQEVEWAQRKARNNGPGSVECLRTSADIEPGPAAFLCLGKGSFSW